MHSDFDLQQGEALKEYGMELAASNKLDSLEYARKLARKLAQAEPNRTCDADQVQELLIDLGIDLGNAAGSLFKSGEWEWAGEFRKSARKTNHARLIRVWRLR